MRLPAEKRKASGKKSPPDNAALFSRYFEAPTIRNRNAIAVANDRLALDIAHRYKNISPVPLEDLAQIARVGLIKAIEKFDRAHGAAFSSFAVPYIRGEILHYMRDDNPDLVNIPRRWREDRAKVRAEHSRWLASGYTVSESEIAVLMGIGNWEEVVHATSRQTVLPIEEGHIASDPIEAVLADDETRAMIRSAIALLPTQLRTIVMESYFKNQTLPAIARRLKISEADAAAKLEKAHAILRARVDALGFLDRQSA